MQNPGLAVPLEVLCQLDGGGLIVLPFSLFETGIRKIVRAIDSSACSGGADPFCNIYR